jgi:hypothetical protein
VGRVAASLSKQRGNMEREVGPAWARHAEGKEEEEGEGGSDGRDVTGRGGGPSPTRRGHGGGGRRSTWCYRSNRR